MPRGPQRLAQLLAVVVGRRVLQRVVGLHAQDEVHAALEVEPELQLLSVSHAGTGRW